MSDKDIDQAAAHAADEESPPIEEKPLDDGPKDDKPAEEASPGKAKPERASPGSSNSVAWLAFLVAIMALAAAGYTAWQSWQSAADTATEDRVARLESGLASTERSLADTSEQIDSLAERDPGIDTKIQALRREFDERVRLLDSLPARMSTLESSVAALAGVLLARRGLSKLAGEQNLRRHHDELIGHAREVDDRLPELVALHAVT